MYITDKFICFYSNLFGMEKKIRIPYSHITLITKEKTALVIPNAIAITTYRKEYIFRSFWDRDECFEMLKAFIKKFKGVPGSTPTTASVSTGSSAVTSLTTGSTVPAVGSPDSLSTASGRFLSTQSDNKATNASSNAIVVSGTSGAGTSFSGASTVGVETGTAASISTAGAEVRDRSGSSGPAATKRKSTALSGDADVEVDSLVGADPKPDQAVPVTNMQASFDAECAKSKLRVVVSSGESLNIGLTGFIEKFIDDSAPYSLQRHHEVIGDQNMNLTKWTVPVGMGGGGETKVITTSTRDMKFMKIVNLPGLKQTRGIKIQKCQRFGDKGLILQTSTRLDDVPMADSFSVEEAVIVRPVGEADSMVNVEIYLEVKFIKYTMLKSLIESNTNGEVTKWLNEYLAAWKAFLSGPATTVGVASSSNLAKDMALFAEESAKSRLKVSCFSNELLNVSLSDFLSNFVEDGASYDLVKHHEVVGDNSMELPLWLGDEYDANRSTRTMKFMKVCNLPGLKQTRAAKSQKWSRCGNAGTVIYTSTKLEDVPFADVFTVDDSFIVKAVGPNQVSIDAMMEVKYVKSTMMKNFIDGSTNKEVVQWCKEYLAALRKHVATLPGALPMTGAVATSTVVPATVDLQVGIGGPLQMVDDFLDSFGFTGGRYIVGVSAILLLTMLFVTSAYRSTNAELYLLRQEIKSLSTQVAELVAQNQQLMGQCTGGVK